jgi:mercuric ion binding protein
MKKLLLGGTFAIVAATTATFLSLGVGSPGYAGEQRARIAVSGLTCPSCSYIVGQAMTSVPGVEIVDFLEGQEFGTAVYVVAYDNSNASPKQIVTAVEGYGYPAHVQKPQS